MRFTAKLEVRSPLAISAGRATGNQMETLLHIPGAVWRGAVAAQWIADHGLVAPRHSPESDEYFQALFLRGLVRFGDLRLKEGKVTKPWPFSARVCKERDTHPVHDLLIRTGQGDVRLPVECSAGLPRAVCGAKLKRQDGFLSLHGDRAEKREVKVRVLAHSAVSNSLLRVREEQFFSQEVLETEQTFEGELWAAPAAEEPIADIGGKRTIQIGRGGTRGMGLADLTITPKAEPAGIQQIHGRLRDVSTAYNRSGHVAFSATLHSPGVFFDEWLLCKPQLEATDIDARLKDYDLVASYSRTTQISGWNGQAQLPKADIAALAPGSCFLFARKLENKGDVPAEIDRLAGVLAETTPGLGEFWEEGFGEVEFCWPFHSMRKFHESR